MFLYLFKMNDYCSLAGLSYSKISYQRHDREQTRVPRLCLFPALFSPPVFPFFHSFSFFPTLPFLILVLSPYPLAAATLGMSTEDEKQNSLVLWSVQNNSKTEEAS